MAGLRGWARDHAKLEVTNERDGREVLDRVVLQFFVDVGEQHHGTTGQDHHGLAIGLGRFDGGEGDTPPGARFVFHHDGAKVMPQGVCHQSAHAVCRAAWGEAHQDFERGLVLGPGAEGQGEGGQCQWPA